MKYNLNERKSFKQIAGISLIVLVITIIVIVILAVAVILSIANNNPIEQAKKAKFQNDLKNMEDELNLYIASEVSDPTDGFDIDELDVKGENVKNIIKSATKEWENKLEIENGKLIFIGEDDTQIEWANEVLSIKMKKANSTTDKIKLIDSVVSNVKVLKIYGNTEQIDGESVSVGNAVKDENDGRYKIPIILSGKNLLKYDGSVTGGKLRLKSSKSYMVINGNNSRNISNSFDSANKIYLNPGNYTFSYNYFSGNIISYGQYDIFWIGLFEKTSNTWYPDNSKAIGIRNSTTTTTTYNSFFDSRNFKFSVNEKVEVSFHIVGCAECDNLTFGVQLEEGNVHTAWEPYYTPIIYTIYLDNPLRKVGNYADYLDLYTGTVYRYVEEKNGQLVGLSTPIEEHIDIPDIVLHEGTNIVSVDTTVSPSKMEAIYISK